MRKSKITVEENKAFCAASAADKRRLIARDVIMQLRLKNYYAESIYVQAYNNSECMVCGIGSCLVSAERLNNPDASIVRIAEKQDFEKLQKYFGEKQLAIIEEFYENSCDKHEFEDQYVDIGGLYEIRVRERTNKIINQAKRYFCNLTPTNRLKRIMENIVRNGKFDYKEEIEFRANPQPKVDKNINRLAELIKSFTSETTEQKEQKNVIAS